jgi:hypothetical protein
MKHGGGVAGARVAHAAGRGPCAGGWVIEFGAGEWRCEGLSREYLRGDDESGGNANENTETKVQIDKASPRQLPVGEKRLYPWYSNWKILQFTCQHCGWTGKEEKTCPNEAERRAAWKRIQSAAKRYGVELEESD